MVKGRYDVFFGVRNSNFRLALRVGHRYFCPVFMGGATNYEQGLKEGGEKNFKTGCK